MVEEEGCFCLCCHKIRYDIGFPWSQVKRWRIILGEVEVGDTDAIKGTIDDVIYNIWWMKEPNYVTRMMATGGRLLSNETCKETVRRWKENG